MINCSELIYKVGNKVDLLPTLYYQILLSELLTTL